MCTGQTNDLRGGQRRGLSSSVKRSLPHRPWTKYEDNHPPRRKAATVGVSVIEGADEGERDDTVFCFLAENSKNVFRSTVFCVYPYRYIQYICILCSKHEYIYGKYCNIICIQYTCIRDVNLLLYRSEYI